MALIKLGAFVTGISGKVGGQSFATGPAGSYIKNIGSYIVKSNAKTAQKLNNFSFLSGQWRLLTNAQREAWQEAAGDFPYQNRLDETKFHSGYILFIKFNGNKIEAGLDLSTSAPVAGTFVPSTGWSVVLAGGDYFLQIPNSFPNTQFALQMARPVSPGRSNAGLNFISVLSGTTPGVGVNLAIDESYTEVFGSYPVGMRYHYRLNLIRTATGQQLRNVIVGSYVLV